MNYKDFLHKLVDGRMKSVGYKTLQVTLFTAIGFCFILFVAG